MEEIRENHCTLVNFPLVSSRAGRMDALSTPTNTLPYAAVNERAEKEKRARTPCIYKYTYRRHTHSAVHVPRKFNRSVHLHACLFPIPHRLDLPSFRIQPATRHYDNREEIFFVLRSHHRNWGCPSIRG